MLVGLQVASGTHAGIDLHLGPCDIGCQYSRSIYTARFIVWQPCRAADTSTNCRQSLFCCCTASMQQATDRAETVAIDGLVSSWPENISVYNCFILSTGNRIRIDSVMRSRSSTRGRNTSASVTVTVSIRFLPRCMKCRRGLAMRILSVRPSVCPSVRPSHAWSLTKWKKVRSRFLYHTKEHLS